jgi:methylisocitrate lyase
MKAADYLLPSQRRALFAERIARGALLEIPGAHDTLSAKLIENAGFPAVLVSGFGLSASQLGLPDMELYTRTENVTLVRNVVMATGIPVMADADDGYGNAINVMRTVREFEAAGASSITLEDQAFPKRCPRIAEAGTLLPVEEAAAKIKAAVAARTDPAMLIIARTDARDVEGVMLRARAYAAAGADLIKPISPVVSSMEFLIALRQACGRPLSLSVLGWLAQQKLDSLKGVVGIATHPFLPLFSAVSAMQTNLRALRNGSSSGAIAAATISEKEFKTLIGGDALQQLEIEYVTIKDSQQ